MNPPTLPTHAANRCAMNPPALHPPPPRPCSTQMCHDLAVDGEFLSVFANGTAYDLR